MAIVGNLVVLLSANNAPLTAGLLKAEGQLKAFGTAGGTASQGLAIIGGAGLVAAAGMGLAVKAAADFQEQMAKVNTIAHQTPDELTKTGEQIRKLSVATGATLPDLTSSFYDLLSVGVPVGQAMEFLTNATTLSIGGLSTSKEAVDAITTSINAWSGATGEANLTMQDSAKVADLWAKGIEVGGFTAADIGTALSNVAAQASTFNTPLEQVVATAALLTTRGFTASTALTSMDAAFTALQRVPPGMEKLQKATGKSYEQIARTQGIHEAITQVVADAGRLGVGLVDVFGRTDALGYVINTTGTSAQAYEAILTRLYDSSGAAAAQAAERSQTLDRQMAILGASVNNLGITLGTALLPPLTTFVQNVSGAVQGVTNWANANPQLSSSLLPVLAGVGILATMLAVLGGPVTLVIGAIALIVTNMDNLARGIQRVIDAWNTLNSLPGFRQSNAAASFSQDFQAKYGRRPTPIELQQAGIGFSPTAPGDRTNPLIESIRGRGGGEVFVNQTTTVVLDGQKVGEVVERNLYNRASTYSSGFSNEHGPTVR